jgi:hypothetical protein
MKKNLSYMQTCVLNEVTKLYSMQKFADGIVKILSKKHDIDVSVYETSDDGFALRKKKDGTVTDNELISALCKTIKDLIEENDDIAEVVQDLYDFELDKKLITDAFMSDIVSIRRSGRLIYIEIDLQ